MDKDIKRFCKIIGKINKINKYLDKKRKTFYDGGYEFSNIYQSDITELEILEDEFKNILNNLNKTDEQH